MNLRCIVGVVIVMATGVAFGQKSVAFQLVSGPGQVNADLYGSGTRGVVLAHGGRFNEESWNKQAEILVKVGFLALSVRFRGDGFNPDGSPGAFGSREVNAADVPASASYLHRLGAKTVSAIGGSMGGDAVGQADAASKPGNFDRNYSAGVFRRRSSRETRRPQTFHRRS